MAVKPITYAGNLGSAHAATDFDWSPNIWGDCNFAAIKEGSIPGVAFEHDFLSFPITPPTTEGNWGPYAVFTDTGGFITPGSGQGGEAVFGSDGDNEGASIRTVATPFKIMRTLKKFWFEARVKASTIADTKNGFFIGLMQNVALTATMPIAAAGTIGDTNLVGFHRLEGDGDMLDTIYKADGVTQVTVQADAVTLVADTYVKIGMKFEAETDWQVADPTLAGVNRYVLSFYKDNLRLATTKQIPLAAGTDFPNDIAMGLVFATLNATGTTPGNNTIDRWRAAQLL